MENIAYYHCLYMIIHVFIAIYGMHIYQHAFLVYLHYDYIGRVVVIIIIITIH